ncbi:MAG: hypothetical protein U0736_20935 [Gemmataceae bacterium]
MTIPDFPSANTVDPSTAPPHSVPRGETCSADPAIPSGAQPTLPGDDGWPAADELARIDATAAPARRAMRLPRHPMRMALAVGLLGLVALAGLADLPRAPVKVRGVNRDERVRVTDADIVRLRRLADLRVAVGDAAMEHLVGLKRLKWLELGQSKVTQIGLAWVKAALPGWEVLWIDPAPAPNPVAAPLEITADITLDPKKTYGPLVVKTSGVSIDSRAGVIALLGDPKDVYRGRHCRQGVSNVTLKNVNVRVGRRVCASRTE